MARKGDQFAGLNVAMTTPFRDGMIDEIQLKLQLEFQIEAKTNCVSPCGTTGESPTLSHDEHERLIGMVCEMAEGRLKITPGTGSNNTTEAIRLTKFAKSVGADGALMVTPYYNKPTQDGFFRHFQAVADAVDLPIILYNIPGRTAKNMEPETIARLGEHPNIVAIKEATGSMDQASSVFSMTNLTVLSGDDSLTLPLLSIGASGVVSVVGNIIPGDVKQMIAAFQQGNLGEAQRWHHKLFPLCRNLLGLSTNPIPIKGAMKLLDRDSGELRLPMTPLNESEFDTLKNTLGEYGLL